MRLSFTDQQILLEKSKWFTFRTPCSHKKYILQHQLYLPRSAWALPIHVSRVGTNHHHKIKLR